MIQSDGDLDSICYSCDVFEILTLNITRYLNVASEEMDEDWGPWEQHTREC